MTSYTIKGQWLCSDPWGILLFIELSRTGHVSASVSGALYFKAKFFFVIFILINKLESQYSHIGFRGEVTSEPTYFQLLISLCQLALCPWILTCFLSYFIYEWENVLEMH